MSTGVIALAAVGRQWELWEGRNGHWLRSAGLSRGRDCGQRAKRPEAWRGETQSAPGCERAERRWTANGLRSLRGFLEDWKAPALWVEVLDAEGRIAGPLAVASPRRRKRLCAGRPDAEEGLRRCRAAEPLMRVEHEVVSERDLEPALQILDGHGTVEAKARGVFERPPEALEAGGGVDVQGGGEAVADAESAHRLPEDPPLELASEIGHEVLRAAEGPGGGGQEASHPRRIRVPFIDM